MYSSLSFALIFILVGIPVWWKATTVYRVSLPYSEIDDLSSKKVVHLVRVHVLLVEKSFSEENLARSLQEEAVRRENQSMGENGFVYKWTVRHAYHDETALVLSGKPLKEVDTAVHHMEHLSADRQLNVVVLPKGLFEQRVTVGLHHTIYIQGEEELQDLAGDIVRAVREDVIREDLLKRLYTSPKSQERTKPDKERMRPLSATNEFDVTFTLVVPEPHILDVSWKIQEAIDGLFL